MNVSNCIQTAELDWEFVDGIEIPISKQFGDVYFSKDNGLLETRHVFLNGNDLSERLANLKDFEYFLNFFSFRCWFLWKFILAKRHILQKQKPPKLANTKCEHDHAGHVRVQEDDDEHATGAGHTNADVLGHPADVGADAGVHVGRRSRQGSGVVSVRAQGAEQHWKK